MDINGNDGDNNIHNSGSSSPVIRRRFRRVGQTRPISPFSGSGRTPEISRRCSPSPAGPSQGRSPIGDREDHPSGSAVIVVQEWCSSPNSRGRGRGRRGRTSSRGRSRARGGGPGSRGGRGRGRGRTSEYFQFCQPNRPAQQQYNNTNTNKNGGGGEQEDWRLILRGHRLYFPPNYSPSRGLDDLTHKIDGITNYLQRQGYLTPDSLLSIDEQEYFQVECEKVETDEFFQIYYWSNFLEDLYNWPEDVVNLWGCVMHKHISEYYRSSAIMEDYNNMDEERMATQNDCRGREGSTVDNVGRIDARLLLTNPLRPIAKLNSLFIDKYVIIRGHVVATGRLEPVCLQMPFQCKACGHAGLMVNQPKGIYTLPIKCGAPIIPPPSTAFFSAEIKNCENDKPSLFIPLETSKNILMMDSRRIKIQDAEHSVGSMPATIECELQNKLTGEVNAGDMITLAGILKIKKENLHASGGGGGGGGGKEQSLHNFYIQAIAVQNHKDSDRTVGGNWFSFSDLDYCAIRRIYDTPNLLKLLVASLCPAIHGHEVIKASLLLSLLGGSESSNKRSDINILMLGDPGIGKSQMLQIISKVAPKCVYVCGTGSTVAGLTATMIKDSGDNGEYTLEAGALTMSDNGVCCLDEFDKMLPQHPALLEVMEQQSVSIAKAGVLRSLPARTTVIAAANPVSGHYDRTKSLDENIKISTPLLSRFDVTFLMLDTPNHDFDKRMGDHVLGVLRNDPTRLGSSGFVLSSSSSSSSTSTYNSTTFTIGQRLEDRLKVKPTEKLDHIPHMMIKKYIAYARQYVNPTLSPEAKLLLKNYYLRLRSTHKLHPAQSIPVITTRQLESLVRLTESRAKLELREEATEDDARDILEIFESSIASIFSGAGEESIIGDSQQEPQECFDVFTGASSGAAGPPTTTTATQQTRPLPPLSASSSSPSSSPMLFSSTVPSHNNSKKNSSNNKKGISAMSKKVLTTLKNLSQITKAKLFSVSEIQQAVELNGFNASLYKDDIIHVLNTAGFLLKKGAGVYQLVD